MKTKRTSFLARTAMTLLFTVLTTVTTWADSWPEYITNVVLVGGTESEAQSAKSDYSGYTWCSTSLNDGTSGDVIYIGYKKSSSPAYINGGYITDFIIIDAGTGTEGHNPPYSLTFQGRTYYRCPAAGGDYFVNSNHGNLTSQAANGWNMYLYYTKNNFDDKRAVDGISIYSVGDINEHKSGAINCYYKDGTLHEKEISLNKGVSKTPYVYMHINTVTKTNRPSTDPVMASGLVYNGSEQMLVASMGTTYDNTYKMWFREIGQNQYFYENTAQFTKATNAGTYNVEYYAGSSTYGDKSETKIHQVTIAKSPNNGVTVSCSNYLEGTAPVPSLVGNNLSKGTITYKYSKSQNGTYTTTVPSEPGTHWVKATIASDNNCFDYTTAPVSFTITYDWALHNSGDTEADAYVISTTSDLNLLAQRVNGGNSYSGKCFRLGGNITYSHTSVWNSTTSTENNYTPIGNNNENKFKGNFDGKGFTISGIRISASNYYNGLFGNLDGATVKNVILSDARIMSTAQYCGGIAGYCSSSTITNCWVKSNVCVGKNNYVGGIVGEIVTGTIMGCRSEAMLKDDSNNRERYGGIAGTVQGQANVKHCIVVGASVPNTKYCGAIVGRWIGNYTNNYYINCTVAGVADATNVGSEGSDRKGACKAVAINTADGVTVTPTGTATTYDVSGITAYEGNNGILYGGKLYAGATESVGLDIAYNIEGFNVTGYNDGNGNALTPVSGNNYTLAMTANAPTVTPVGSDVWGVTTAGRDGSAEHPYLITEPAGLDLLAKKVNGTDGYSANTFSGTYFELGDNITYDGTENNYTPIGGNGNHEFAGHFDGKGHTVSGIRINANANKQGLFGYISGSGCEVKNITVTDATIIIGGNYQGAGSIAGRCDDNAVIENCHATEEVRVAGVSQAWIIGGIVGNNFGYVRGCTSTATVSVENRSAGAIVGSNCKTIENCLVLGASVSGTQEVGAIVGYNYNGTLTNNFYTGSGIGGINGSDTNGATIAYEFPAAISAMGAKGTTYAAGTDYEGVTAYANGLAYNGKYYYPSLWTGDGTSDNPYIIYTTAGLDKLASDVNGGNNYAGKYFELGNDIDYSEVPLTLDGGKSNYTAIGKYNGSNDIMTFSGHFDGKGHTISGIRITKDGGGFKYSYQGVFGYIRNATVKNVKLTDTRITAADHIGGIAGFNSASTIENCHVTNTVTIQSNGNSEIYLGGIAGELHDYNGVDPCVRGCTSAATVSGDTEVGGIVGKLYDGSIIDCLYLGTSVTGTYHIGAIVGHNVNNTLSNNYYTTYGLGGIGSDTGATGSDVAGACFANEYPAATGAMGAVVSTYGTGDYTGMTVYTEGLAYNGKYYCPLPWTGDGTAEHPFVISTTDGLDKLAIKVNGGTSYSGKYFELGNDITYSYDGLAEGESNFTTIGENGYWFSGTFDGKGHTVSGIRISDTNGIFKAIFGWVDGTVKNLVVSDCRIEARQDIGGIVAQLYSGTIENCHVLSDVTLTGYMYIGGITADIYGGTIKGCTSAARITGTKSGDNNARYLGGIVGYATEYADNSPKLTDNLFTGTISGDLLHYIGAIVGNLNSGSLTNNYHTLSGMGGVGNENDATSCDEDGATIAYELAAANAAMGAVGSTYGTGDYTGITAYENGLAYNGKFYSPIPWGGSGTEADPYIIVNTQGMDLLATNVNGGNDYQDTYFVLGNDIVYAPDVLTLDLDGDGNNDSNYMPVGKNGSPFMGNFDGQGHTISGISVNEMYYIGVFGINDGTVKNLTVSDCLFAGSQTIGAVAGLNRGTVENCHVAAYVSVTGNNGVGGVVGNNEGSVLGCTSAAALSTKEYADFFGGIAGSNAGTLTDNLFTGTIDKMPDGSWGIGAITGYHNTDYGTLTNNFHTCSGMGGVGNEGNATNTDQAGAQFAVSSNTEPDEATIGTAGTPYAEDETYQGITPYSKGLYYDGRYYWHEAFLRGDANGDGQVTITDAVAVVNYILGNPSENFNKAAANVNGDTDEHGEPIISITDAVGVVNIILNGAASTPAFTAPALTAPEDDDASPVDPE